MMNEQKRIFMLIDFQNDFVRKDGKLTCNNEPLIDRVEEFIGKIETGMFDEAVVTIDTHFDNSYPLTHEAKNFPKHCLYGTEGAEIAVPLDKFKEKNIPVIEINKMTTNMWAEEYQYAYLKEKDWSNAVVYLSGVLTEICVRQAMDGLLDNGAKVVLMDDLTGGLSLTAKDMAKEPQYEKYVREGKLEVMDTVLFLAQFQKQRTV